jgi:phosphatidylserine decarboxylase
LKEWRSTAVEKYKDLGLARVSHQEFLRDPCRAQRVDSRFFFSPADGILIARQTADPDTDLIETKGTHCTLRQLMAPWQVDRPCLVVSVFLTFYDVHIIRCPTGALLSHQHAKPLRTMNLPMLWEEQQICKKGRVSAADERFMASNSRTLCRFWSSSLAYRYFLVLLADSDVSAIMPFDPGKHAPMAQSERCFQVRWGSQASLVLPLDSRYYFQPLCEVTDHLEAGVDALIEIQRAHAR